MGHYSKILSAIIFKNASNLEPPNSCKMDTFFLRSLALSVQIYSNFQSNEVSNFEQKNIVSIIKVINGSDLSYI